MSPDRNRQPGFYWVRFEGEVIVAEYVTACTAGWAHWHVPGSKECFDDSEVCHLISTEKLRRPSGPEQTQIHTQGTRAETGGELDSTAGGSA